MLSYWENVSFINYDLIIVGSGIVGLSTAVKYKKRHPSATIAILERGVFPSGASTKMRDSPVLDPFLNSKTIFKSAAKMKS